jgi:hypothetical protein
MGCLSDDHVRTNTYVTRYPNKCDVLTDGGYEMENEMNSENIEKKMRGISAPSSLERGPASPSGFVAGTITTFLACVRRDEHFDSNHSSKNVFHAKNL